MWRKKREQLSIKKRERERERERESNCEQSTKKENSHEWESGSDEGKNYLNLNTHLSYLPIPPLRQVMTQGQF